MKSILAVPRSVLATTLLLGLTGCGADAPTLAPFVGPDLTGTWRFSWTLEDSCELGIDFEVASAGAGYFQGTQTGTPPSFCLPEWPAELSRGTVLGQVSEDGTLWFRGRWKEAEITLEATARLATIPTEMVDGEGGWELWGIGEWWEDPGFAPGTFTAILLTSP